MAAASGHILPFISELRMMVTQLLVSLAVVRVFLSSDNPVLGNLFSLFVCRLHHEIAEDRRRRTDQVEAEQDAVALEEARRSVVDLGRNDAVALREDLRNSPSSGSLGVAGVGAQEPGGADHDCRIAAGGDEGTAGHKGSSVGRGQHDNEAGQRGCHAAEEGDKSFVGAIGVNAHHWDGDDRESIRYNADQLGLHCVDG